MCTPSPTSLVPKKTVQGPTAEEWETMKENIYQLYIIQGQPLKRLIPEMKDKHEFNAT